MPFELKSPTGLWLLGLAVPLVVLYILKIRRQRLPIASTWLWSQAQRDLLAKSPFKKLIMQVPLLLQLLALILLALALSSPATRGGAIIGDHVAVVVDTSASMSAKDAEGKSRISLAKQAAKDVLSGLGPGAEAMILEASRDARIASPLDRDRRRLEAAVEQLTAHDVEGRLGQAISIASDRLRGLSGEKRIVVITDGALAQKDALANVTLPVDVIQVGSPVENAAVLRVDVREGTDPATKKPQVQVFAMLANFGDKARDGFVVLRMQNVKDPLASRRIRLNPGERSPVTLTFEPVKSDAGSGLVVELSPGDALAADDRAYARVPLGRQIPVVMAPKNGNVWIQRALLADPAVELMGTSVASLNSSDIPDDALVVIDGACPSQTPGGDFIVLDPPAGRCLNATVAGEIDKPSITSWVESDPRLRFLTLDGVDLLKARKIETEGPQDSLVRTRDGTVISDISVPGRTGTLIAFDVGDSNWPLKASFVLFVRNLVELARTHRARGITGPARTGEPMRVRVPPEVNEVALVDPAETKSKLPARNGLVVVPEVSGAGFYHVSWQGARGGSVLVAANLTSELESDTRPVEIEIAGVKGPQHVKKDVEAFTDWTWLLALVALLFIVFDVWWLTRRPASSAHLGSRPRLPERPRPERAS